MDTSSFTVGLLCPGVYRTLSPLGRGQGEGANGEGGPNGVLLTSEMSAEF